MSNQRSQGSAKKSQWLFLAVGSGGFAACNGVFAKLTTTAQTHDLAGSISGLFGFDLNSPVVEYLLRGVFFALNLLSNAVMWILFTRALTASTSTTRVSILNVSANFIVTALFGTLVFAEKLSLGWWCGAALLVAGSVVIGRRESVAQVTEGEQKAKDVALGSQDTGGDTAAAMAKNVGKGAEADQDLPQRERFRDDSDGTSSDSGSEAVGARGHERYSDDVGGLAGADSR